MNTTIPTKEAWEAYCEQELNILRPILETAGITLHQAQPHISGERFLMQAITTSSGKKLILIGEDTTGKVVIKAANDVRGVQELLHERNCRKVLTQLDFAAEIFHTPTEIAFIEKAGYVISVQRFIEQPMNFLERSLEEQFSLSLRAFKEQESAHAATYKHRHVISKVFGIRDRSVYLQTFSTFLRDIQMLLPLETQLHALLQEAQTVLQERQMTIEQYSGFLTHTDFVPHNIRISSEGIIYLLDYSSLTFGNKYEGWARFINFMTLYNPPLKQALEQYVRDNRAQEESESLHLMRLYRLGEIIYYYSRTLEKSADNLLQLNTARVRFWSEVLRKTLAHEEVEATTIAEYTALRNTLRSEDERIRQQNLH